MTANEAAALSAALAAQHAAVYAYAMVGAQGGASSLPQARRRLQDHAVRRDVLAARLSAAGQRPVPAEPAYAMPFPVRSPTAARALAAHVEGALAAVYADLVAAAAPGRRVEAARWLAENAVAAVRWGGRPVPFPGLPERGEPA